MKGVVRFIPTGVGNTNYKYLGKPSISVHPHWRGEHSTSTGWSRTESGSSPLAWGTLVPVAAIWECSRFIPTGVGNTIKTVRMSSKGTVHPHWRGEHKGGRRRRCWLCGSSPLAWGTRFIYISEASIYRFIPTGVGNTGQGWLQILMQTVHPHWRGEHKNFGKKRERLFGSSPLAWGTHLRQFCPQFRLRFIPTGVGNTRFCRAFREPSPVHPHWRGEHRRMPRRTG